MRSQKFISKQTTTEHRRWHRSGTCARVFSDTAIVAVKSFNLFSSLSVFQFWPLCDPPGTFWGWFCPIIASSITALFHHQLLVQRFPLNLTFYAKFVFNSQMWLRRSEVCVVCFLLLVFLRSHHQWGKSRLKRQRYPWAGSQKWQQRKLRWKKGKEQCSCESSWGERKALERVWSITEVQISNKLRAESSLPLTDGRFLRHTLAKTVVFTPFYTVFKTGYSCHHFHF